MMPIRQHALEPRLPVPDRDALDETVLNQQVEHSVDARAARCPTLRTQRILDLDDAQSTRLCREQLNHAVARSAALEARPRQDRVNVLAPTIRRHRAQD